MKRFFKLLKWLVIGLITLIVILSIITFFYIRQAKFGQAPSGERLARMEKSPHYKNGRFVNLVIKPTIAPGYSIWGEMYDALFKKNPRGEPLDPIPSIKTDLKKIPPDSDVVVWFGHSSCFIQLYGKKFLIDPIFSGNASPFPGSVKAYPGSDIYSADDVPEIDYLLISHDHYDHLDYETMTALKDQVKHVICGLGVGSHVEHWGYPPEKIIEKDWYENVHIAPGFTVFAESSHHESGRGFSRGNTLWMSYLIASPSMKIYISGDGGSDDRFADIGNRFGPIDFAIMECGQYNKAWHSVHELPEEVVQATLNLKAKRMLPVHHSKFTLSKHDWDEPLKRITALSEGKSYSLATPMIGEVLYLNDSAHVFKHWWVGVR